MVLSPLSIPLSPLPRSECEMPMHQLLNKLAKETKGTAGRDSTLWQAVLMKPAARSQPRKGPKLVRSKTAVTKTIEK